MDGGNVATSTSSGSTSTRSGNMTKAPLGCAMCGVGFDSTADQRRHAKDEWHIYRLRCRVASPDTIVPPPGDGVGALGGAGESDESEDGEDDEDEYSSDEEEDDESDGASSLQFIPGQCLFCADSSADLASNLAHMLQAHSFTVPYQDRLAVDLETLLWYLCLVVRGYRECVLCGARRASVEAVQQHMMAKGHCRLDPASGDVADFYGADLPGSARPDGELTRPDEASLRLPSGKLLGHRSQPQAQPPRRRLSSSPQQQQLPGNPRRGNAPASDALISSSSGRERRAEELSAQMARLSAADRAGLAHLPGPQQRAALATRKRQLDAGRRAEGRARLRVERLGNRTLMKHFKPDVPGRSNG